jgi:hypothetical protein
MFKKLNNMRTEEPENSELDARLLKLRKQISVEIPNAKPRPFLSHSDSAGPIVANSPSKGTTPKRLIQRTLTVFAVGIVGLFGFTQRGLVFSPNSKPRQPNVAVQGAKPSHAPSIPTKKAKHVAATTTTSVVAQELNPCRTILKTDVATMKASKFGASVKVWGSPDMSKDPNWILVINDDNPAPYVFRVLDEKPGWLHVDVPARPNGSTGWVQAKSVSRFTTPFSLVLHLSKRELSTCDLGKVIRQESVELSDLPTPQGVFVYESLVSSERSGSRSSFAMTLSGFGQSLAIPPVGSTMFERLSSTGRLVIIDTDLIAHVNRKLAPNFIALPKSSLQELAKTIFPGSPVVILD